MTQLPVGFAQCRAIAHLNWQTFLATNKQITNPTENVLKLDARNITKRELTNAIFELNSLNTHNALWKEATRDPLSTAYSVAWTLCSSLNPPISMLEDYKKSLQKEETTLHYYSVWYAFGLLHKYVDYLWRRALPNNVSPKMAQLFTLDQLVHVDVEYVRAFEDIRELKMRNQVEASESLLERYEQEYLTSELFKQALDNTPFGTVQRHDEADEDNTNFDYTISLEYVPKLRNVEDRIKLSNSFKRIECFEPLRLQSERMLRSAFPTYSSKRAGRQLRVRNWILSLLDSEDESINELGTKKSKPEYLLYWQFQKSGLVWFLLHTLFALNDLVRNDDLNADLLFFVSEHLDKLIECGVCAAHWKQQGQIAWSNFSKWYESNRSLWVKDPKFMGQQGSYYNYNGTFGNPDYQPDMYMFYTHNEIQSNNINNSKRLTDTCLHAIRIDFLQYAMAIEASVVPSEHASEVDARLDTLWQMERKDVLYEPEQVYAYLLLKSFLQEKTTPKSISLEEQRKYEIAQERRRIFNAVHGYPF